MHHLGVSISKRNHKPRENSKCNDGNIFCKGWICGGGAHAYFVWGYDQIGKIKGYPSNRNQLNFCVGDPTMFVNNTQSYGNLGGDDLLFGTR